MSIATEITRLQNLRNTLCIKLTSMLGIASGSNLEDCVTAVADITDHGAITAAISQKDQEIAIAAGYHNGSGKVSLSSVEKAKLIGVNIKSGVTLLGVAGTCTPSNTVAVQASKSVTPTKAIQTVEPDAGYDALGYVQVAAIPDAYQNVTGVTAAAAHVLTGKTIVSSTGEALSGTMTDNGAIAQTINGTTTTCFTIPMGFHNGAGTISLDNTIETMLATI